MFVDSDSRFDPFGEVISIDSASLGTASPLDGQTPKTKWVKSALNSCSIPIRVIKFLDYPNLVSPNQGGPNGPIKVSPIGGSPCPNEQ